jgi:diaminohydroxyphosphoribosylaminopyrimidine deaminase/5-amino-6-(5-phosphoribosylamino)uracil reductase
VKPGRRDDRAHLRRAAGLAAGSALDVLPDPPVGCVLVDPSGRVVGEGFHRAYGGPHAEAEALAAAGASARGATAYVTLEPCQGGAGKRTPPCAAALRDAGVAAVVHAAVDPSAQASGSGPALLRAAGIEVRAAALPEAEVLLAPWRAALDDPFPWTVAKWAMSLDGRTADAWGGARWISGKESREWSHLLRARVDAVVVGSRTAALDDPDLRPRPSVGFEGRPPLRVVVDGALRLPPGGKLASTAREGPVLVAAGTRAPAGRRAALAKRGVEVREYPGAGGGVDLGALFRDLRARGARRVLLEGGSGLHAAALRAGLVRQAAVFVAPAILGGRNAPGGVGGEEGLRTAAGPLRLRDVRVTRCGEDVLVEGFVA